MRKREILTKVIMPVGMILLLAVIFRPFCMIQEKLDWRLLVLLMGIPFGVHKMCLWLVPSGMGISGTVGMVAFNLLIGGVIGSVVMFWRLLVAAFTLVRGFVSGALCLLGAR